MFKQCKKPNTRTLTAFPVSHLVHVENGKTNLHFQDASSIIQVRKLTRRIRGSALADLRCGLTAQLGVLVHKKPKANPVCGSIAAFGGVTGTPQKVTNREWLTIPRNASKMSHSFVSALRENVSTETIHTEGLWSKERCI